MDRYILFTFRHRRLIIGIFLAVAVVCALLSRLVVVNSDIMDYLPSDTAASRAMELMDEEFAQEVANLRIMVEDVSIPQANSYALALERCEGVADVAWLGDHIDINVPLAMSDAETVSQWYKDGAALYSLTMATDNSAATFADINAVLPETGVAMSGNPLNAYSVKSELSSEMTMMMLIVIPIVLIILLLTTNSWAEPFLFLITVGVAILINMGTNLIFGSVSFVTQSAASILQLAVSMDYSIFLLHSFSAYRKQGLEVNDAMRQAIKSSASSVVASGITTVVGFAALMFMDFGIGSDMGRVMAKAIACSLLCSLVFLPLLGICCNRLIEKTAHRSIIPPMEKLAGAVFKIRKVAIVAFVLLLVPCFLAAQSNTFVYGGDVMYGDDTTKIGHDKLMINERFGVTNQMVLMVPKGDIALERELVAELSALPEITDIVSYTNTVGAEIPMEVVPEKLRSLLLSEHYSRLVITASTAAESEETFALVEQIRSVADGFYHGDTHLAGNSPSTYDMKQVITVDNTRVNIIAIGSIILVLLLTFRSATLPVLLVAVIEGSIWMNLSFPYFAGDGLSYMAYLIISSMQLGATVDYAILMANRYLDHRALMPKRQALHETVSVTTVSIVTSAAIFAVCGTILGAMSSNGIISQLGYLVGRAGLLSGIMVIFVLPALLYSLDGLIKRTTTKKKVML